MIWLQDGASIVILPCDLLRRRWRLASAPLSRVIPRTGYTSFLAKVWGLVHNLHITAFGTKVHALELV